MGLYETSKNYNNQMDEEDKINEKHKLQQQLLLNGVNTTTTGGGAGSNTNRNLQFGSNKIFKNQFEVGEDFDNMMGEMDGPTSKAMMGGNTGGNFAMRAENGMVLNNNKDDLNKNNDIMAMVSAKVANKKGKKKDVEIPDEMEDSRSMAEFFSESLSYGPWILKDAVHKGDAFERFKLTLKFAFSIIHNITN